MRKLREVQFQPTFSNTCWRNAMRPTDALWLVPGIHIGAMIVLLWQSYSGPRGTPRIVRVGAFSLCILGTVAALVVLGSGKGGLDYVGEGRFAAGAFSSAVVTAAVGVLLTFRLRKFSTGQRKRS